MYSWISSGFLLFNTKTELENWQVQKIATWYSCKGRNLEGQRLSSEQLDSDEERQQRAVVVNVHINKDTDKKFTVAQTLGQVVVYVYG